jgi:NADPH:quinone reductase-like Zn-dependent oxidoreductase
MGGVVGGSGGKSALLIACNSVESGTVALHSTSANLDLFRAIKAAPNATEVIHSFLLQIVALISSEQIHSSVDSKMNDATDDNTAREHLMKESRRASEEIIDVIVDIVSLFSCSLISCLSCQNY